MIGILLSRTTFKIVLLLSEVKKFGTFRGNIHRTFLWHQYTICNTFPDYNLREFNRHTRESRTLRWPFWFIHLNRPLSFLSFFVLKANISETIDPIWIVSPRWEISFGRLLLNEWAKALPVWLLSKECGVCGFRMILNSPLCGLSLYLPFSNRIPNSLAS